MVYDIVIILLTVNVYTHIRKLNIAPGGVKVIAELKVGEKTTHQMKLFHPP